MNRRDLLKSLPFLGTLRAAGKTPITAVELWRFEGSRTAQTGVDRQHQVNPLHIYEGLRPKEYRDGAAAESTVAVTAIYLRVAAGGGEGWYGPVDKEAALVIDQQLATFLKGKDAMAGETLWDQMHRLNRHARTGHFMMAISAVDNAIWDLRGRVLSQPVYRLLGGPSRDKVAAYGSCLGYSVEPAKVRARSVALKQQGFRHQKWFLAFGPGDGAEGLAKNVALVQNLRESVGNDVDLMFDAFMGWDLNYALEWAKQVEQYRPRWIEEAFAPDKIESFAALRRQTRLPVASGEHFYGRWEVDRYLKARALNVVQADPEWCGGISELVKICALASVDDVQVVPHGHALHAPLHVVASQSPMTCPLVENLILKLPSYYYFEKFAPRVENGFIALNERPGFGIEFDEARVLKRTRLAVQF